MLNRLMGAFAVFLFLVPSQTWAMQPESRPAAAEVSDVNVGSYRAKANEWMISPGSTGTVSTQLNFITTDENVGIVTGNPGRLKFTDAVLFRMATRYSVAGVAELFLDAALIPKQPSTMDELAFQNAGFGLRIGLAEFLATSLRVAGGSTLAGEGAWGSATLGLDGRFSIDDFVVFDTGLYGMGTGVSHNDEGAGVVEVVGSFQIVLKAPRYAAMWVGTEFAFPVAESSNDALPIDSQNRVNVQIGGVLSFIENWDIYAKYQYIDRGDIEQPATILPILDGGFDQQQLVFGLTYHFGEADPDESHHY